MKKPNRKSTVIYNIIHVIPAISNESSGPSYSVVRLCDSLITEGNNITLAALDWVSMNSPPSFLKAFPLGWGIRKIGNSPAMKQWLNQQAQLHKVSIIHNHSLWMMPNVYPGQVAQQYGIPYIVSPRGTLSEWAMQSGSWIKKVFWPLIQKPALTSVTCFHATAESEYEDIRRMGFKQPVAIIPNGIDIPDFPPKKIQNSRTLLFLGRIHPVKGLDMLLPAWKTIQNRFPDWRLQIVGPDNGGYLVKMQQLAEKLELKRVEFSGALHGLEKWQAYRNADLFILPTYSENFGMSVAEALAAGTPAIVTKGAPWAGLEKQHAGWWIETHIDAIVNCLDHALSQPPSSLQTMGENGKKWMQAEYSWAGIAQKMTTTYQWLLAGAGNETKPNWVRLD
jgi:glycosyltransferase involved in cell wall biosynthesis